jgi:hypothetical protein
VLRLVAVNGRVTPGATHSASGLRIQSRRETNCSRLLIKKARHFCGSQRLAVDPDVIQSSGEGQ